QRDEYLDALQRLEAEFDNYRKRTAREQLELTSRAAQRLVNELLPVLDDLERALDAAEEHEEAKLEDGVRLVHRSLVGALRKEGQTAYDVLSESEKRKQYDSFGNGRVRGGGGGPGGVPFDFNLQDFDLSDILGGVFNRGSRAGSARRQPQRGADVEAVVNLSF